MNFKQSKITSEFAVLLAKFCLVFYIAVLAMLIFVSIFKR